MSDLPYQSDDFDDEDQPLNLPHLDELALTENFDYVTITLVT